MLIAKVLHIARNIRNNRYIDKRYKAELREMQGAGYVRKKLPPELKKKYRDYYASFGFRHVSLDWIEYIYSVKGDFDVGYIPDNLYHKYIDPLFPTLTREVQDKAYQPFMMAGLAEYPVTVVKNVEGAFLDGENRFISEEEALRLIRSRSEVIIKPTMLTGAGLNVMLCRGEEADSALLAHYGRDYIVQEKLRQYSGLASMNESSVNTVKILSFFFRDKVSILSSCLRVGETGSHIDSFTGRKSYWVRICPDGRLYKEGYTFCSETVTETVEGEPLSAHTIPCYDEMVRIAEEGHRRLLHRSMVGWDFAVNEEGRPILIEYNFKGVPIVDYEILAGPLFGDMLDDILREAAKVRRRRRTGNTDRI